MVEISKALARDPKILILDEATSALTAADVRRVFALLKRLRSEGLAIVYISHRMNESTELADECSVFRNGSHVATFDAGTRSNAETIEMMIGRDIAHAFPPKPAPLAASDAATPALETRGLILFLFNMHPQLHRACITSHIWTHGWRGARIVEDILLDVSA